MTKYHKHKFEFQYSIIPYVFLNGNNGGKKLLTRNYEF